MAKSEKSGIDSPKINLTAIRAQMREAVFNPNADSPMKAVAQMKEPVYYECRMMELIQRAKAEREGGSHIYVYNQLMKQVMQLAALANLSAT